MRPLNILHVTPYAPDAWAYGGIPRIVGSLTREMARRGHRVTVCTTDACDAAGRLPSRAASRNRANEAFGADPRIDVRIFPNLSNRLAYHLQFFLPLGLDSYLRQHARAFDIAHLHACRNVPGVIAARRLRQAGVPYVLAPNGTAPRLERHLLVKRLFDAVAGNRVLRGAARFLAVSAAERRQLELLGIDNGLIRVVPNPVDLDEFTRGHTPGTFRSRHGIPPGRVVLFLGKLTPRKRVDLLVEAFGRLKRTDTSLVIAGNDMGAGTSIMSLVRSLDLSARTFFTGLLRGEERLEALADADVLVYPSEHEIFGLVPLESILTGTPVIVADDSGCGEVVRLTGGGRVIPHGDSEILQYAIDDILENHVNWRNAATSAALRVRALYATDTVCAQIETVYNEMTAARVCTA